MSAQSVLTVSNVIKRYGRLTVLDGVDFSLGAGNIVALLGTNGAGKTTTFKCTLGLTDFSGRIEVAGRSVAKHGKAVRGLIGYLPQTPGFADNDTCAEALSFLASLRRVSADRIGPLLERVSLHSQRHVRTRELSGGMRQRLALAAALLSDPPLLLLDEPTANLDLQSRDELHDLLVQLRDEGKTIVLSTHFIEHVADVADRVIVLKGGKVALDESAETLISAAGKHLSVSMNGTATNVLMDALRAAGISEHRVAPARPDLERAIEKALAEVSSEEATR